MTETIQDLYEKVEAAEHALQVARNDFKRARWDASGMIGKVATDKNKSLLVDTLEFMDFRGLDEKPWVLLGNRILKDGTLGARARIWTSEIESLSDSEPQGLLK